MTVQRAAVLPSVSVVIPVLNGAATIGDTLQALSAQSGLPREFEIIVVDNGSTDETREVVSRFSNVVLLSESRRGPSAARNTGLRAAKYDIILHCDADTLPARRWVASLAQCFLDPDAHLAAGNTLSYSPSTGPERYMATAQMYVAEDNINRPVLPFVSSMNMAVRRETALALLWNEDMLTSEDVDFSTRLLKRNGGPIRYAPGAVVFHRHRSNDDALKKQAWTYGEGIADTYRRYPDEVSWSFRQYLHLAPQLAARGLAPAWLRVAKTLRLANENDLEHARYHRMWTWWFWGGFMSFYRHGERRPAWGAR